MSSGIDTGELMVATSEGMENSFGLFAYFCTGASSFVSEPDFSIIPESSPKMTEDSKTIISENDNIILTVKEEVETTGNGLTVVCGEVAEESWTLVVKLFEQVCRIVWRMLANEGLRCGGLFSSGRGIGIFERQFLI